MKFPKTFISDKDFEEKTKELTKEREPKKKEDVPENIKTLEDTTKYITNSIIPVYGYDDRKRIHSVEMTIKETFQHKILLGGLNLLDENPICYQGLYFNKFDKCTEPLSLDICLNIQHLTYEVTKEGAEKVKASVYEKKNKIWQLIGVYNQPGLILYTSINVDTPKEILWIFETFKDFKPVIHGGTLRDLYLGIARTGDVDVELSPDGNKGEKELYKLVCRVMDKVEHAEKGRVISSYYTDQHTPAQYRAKKDGISYDIAGSTFPRYLSTEEVMMKKPGELLIHRLTKYDLDNKQFRLIDSYKVPERIVQKIFKLQNLGLTFLPEDPSNLSRKLNPQDLLKEDTEKTSSARYYY